jgi:hypothetical protein
MPKVKVRKSQGIKDKVHGKVIARSSVAEENRRAAARKFLKSLRKTAKIGDIMSPSGDAWRPSAKS